MKRLNIYSGLAITFTLILSSTWIYRHRVILPEITEGRMFSVHEISDHNGMVDVELHCLSDNRLLSSASMGENNFDIFDESGSVFGNRNQGAFSPSAPRVSSSRKFKDDERAGNSRGLLGVDGNDAFSEINSGREAGSWGWLADDIQTAERGAIYTDRDGGGQRETRRLFGDDNDGFGRRSGSNRDSGDSSFFRRQDLRW